MANQPNSLEDCFKQGAEARQDGRKPADNPYDIETDQHKEWAAGWHATLDLDEDDDPASMRIGSGGPEGTDQRAQAGVPEPPSSRD